MNACHICGVPWDAGFFDDSKILEAPPPGAERVLAHYELHRNYCGILISFSQFTDRFAQDPSAVTTPGYQWQLRCNGRPRDPYLSFGHIINPWGSPGVPVHLRLEEGCVLEFAVRNVGAAGAGILKEVGGRVLGRYWYNTAYGGAPNPL